jgi:hypothetical protein
VSTCDDGGPMPQPSQSDKFGWRVLEWCAAVGVSRSTAYRLLSADAVKSVTVGKTRIILTHPREFLAAQLHGQDDERRRSPSPPLAAVPRFRATGSGSS